MIDLNVARDIQNEVFIELVEASKKHGSFRSAHEGWAVLKEEVDELWDEVKRKFRSEEAMRKEAVQVAAMALRFIYDVTDTRPHAEVGSESAHSPAPGPPATQRTSPSAIRLSLAEGSPEVHIAAASPKTARDLCQEDRETSHQTPSLDDVGRLARSEPHQRLMSLANRMEDQRQLNAGMRESPRPQEAEGPDR